MQATGIHSTMPPITLAHLHPGDTATIVAIHAEEALHQRLLALGFRSGKQIELIRKASFSGPLQVRIGTTDILLRRTEAAKIKVCKRAADV
jgi:ferrous iron transport protein A